MFTFCVHVQVASVKVTAFEPEALSSFSIYAAPPRVPFSASNLTLPSANAANCAELPASIIALTAAAIIFLIFMIITPFVS